MAGMLYQYKRILEHDGFVAQQGLLFGGGINPVIGIQGGDVADFDV